MTLDYLVDNINKFDEDLIIFQERELSYNSDVVLFKSEDSHGFKIKFKDGIKYVYFLKILEAKEFIEDFMQGLEKQPTKEIALRLFRYTWLHA